MVFLHVKLILHAVGEDGVIFKQHGRMDILRTVFARRVSGFSAAGARRTRLAVRAHLLLRRACCC